MVKVTDTYSSTLGETAVQEHLSLKWNHKVYLAINDLIFASQLYIIKIYNNILGGGHMRKY